MVEKVAQVHGGGDIGEYRWIRNPFEARVTRRITITRMTREETTIPPTPRYLTQPVRGVTRVEKARMTHRGQNLPDIPQMICLKLLIFVKAATTRNGPFLCIVAPNISLCYLCHSAGSIMGGVGETTTIVMVGKNNERSISPIVAAQNRALGLSVAINDIIERKWLSHGTCD